MIDTVKPSAVAVVLPNVGVNAAASEVAVTVAMPFAYPVLVVTIVAIEGVCGATPVTVTRPLPLMVAAPAADAVPVHV